MTDEALGEVIDVLREMVMLISARAVSLCNVQNIVKCMLTLQFVLVDYIYLFLKHIMFQPKFLVWSACVIDRWTLVHPVCESD